MAVFDADKPVNNAELPELEILGKKVHYAQKKGILYFTKDDVTIEMTGVFKEKSNGEITGKVTSLAAKDEDDKPIWDIANFKYDFVKLFTQIGDGKLDKVINKLFKGKDTIWGSHFDDELHGLKGNDTIDGWRGDDRINGGKGKDSLQGRQGNDTFVFDQKLTKKNADKIVKFNVKHDSFELDKDIFTGLDKGQLHEDYFTIGKHAEGDDPQILYKKNKGKVFFDPDGDGPDKALKFADVGKNKNLHHDDFFVA